MKLSTITMILSLCLVSTTFAYDYVIEDGDNFEDLSLINYETLLMTGGEGHHLNLSNWSEATIQNTAPLVDENHGGIWYIGLATYSHLDFSGGEVHQLDLSSYATATLRGGLIEVITGTQMVAPDPHIEIICGNWSWDEPTNILIGTWADYSTFDIQLDDWPPYDPIIENIKFTIVPEPFSFLLFAAGATLITPRGRLELA